MTKANSILLKVLGLLLLLAAVLEGRAVAHRANCQQRHLVVPAIPYLPSRIRACPGHLAALRPVQKAAWLAALTCFSLFSFVTFYKALTGAASCGCFGSVHVNPWVTLLIIDIAALVALMIFRSSLLVLRRQESISALIREFLAPSPSLPRFAFSATLGLLALAVTTPILALNEPAAVTSDYEVVEPETWPGKQLPILGCI